MGATKKLVLFNFAAPGEHHLKNSSPRTAWSYVELAHFTAEPGKVYFYRTRIFVIKGIGLFEYFSLAPLDSDARNTLFSTHPMV